MILAAHLTAKRGSTYNPATRKVVLGDAPTPYQLAHERAHEWQHEARTWIWRVHERVDSWPYVGRIARLGIEIEASVKGYRALPARYRNHAARWEAVRGVLSYVRALVF